jgi:hypothetical protein
VLLPVLNEHLPECSFQHGFRATHSTTSALLDLNNSIAKGFNQRKPPGRTVLLQIDLSKAFDMVNHDKLLEDLNSTSLPGALVRWFCCYLKGRQSRVLFRDCLSPSRNVHTGVPQGAVSSPKMYNFYVKDIPVPPEGVEVTMYADDVSIYAVGPIVQSLCDKINTYIPRLLQFVEERALALSPEKSTVTLFTPQSSQAKVHPQISMGGTLVPLEQRPKVLGVTHDTMYTFTPHCRIQAAKVRQRNNILKALAGSTWGRDRETLLLTYSAIGRSVAEYAAPIWAPVACDAAWDSLQVAQNEALRIATGCHKKAGIDHLHQESKMLRVRNHSTLLAKQYTLACYQPHHPGHRHTTQPDPPRQMKGDLMSNRAAVEPLTAGGVVDTRQYRAGLRRLHTEAVHEALQDYAPNNVLGCSPPAVAASEQQLSRRARSVLSQLRSGYCNLLNSYKARLSPDVQNICPECGVAPHDVAHLFDCTARPTQLSTRDLWDSPGEVATFLDLIHDDDDLT